MNLTKVATGNDRLRSGLRGRILQLVLVVPDSGGDQIIETARRDRPIRAEPTKHHEERTRCRVQPFPPIPVFP
jgi:hypothetical protein